MSPNDSNASGHLSRPVPIAQTPLWIPVVGALFALMTFAMLAAFTFISGKDPQFSCNAFVQFSALFAFGCAISAAFITGTAAAEGKLGTGGQNNSIAFGVGGGIAVLFIAFFAIRQFPPSCSSNHVSIDDFFLLNEKLLSGSYNDGTLVFNTVAPRGASDPMHVTDANDFFVPALAIVSGYSSTNDDTIRVEPSIHRSYKQDGHAFQDDSAIPTYRSAINWDAGRPLALRSGGEKKIIADLASAHVFLPKGSFPILMAVGCNGNIPPGTKQLDLRLSVFDAISQTPAAKTLTVNLDWGAQQEAMVNKKPCSSP